MLHSIFHLFYTMFCAKRPVQSLNNTQLHELNYDVAVIYSIIFLQLTTLYKGCLQYPHLIMCYDPFNSNILIWNNTTSFSG